MGVVFARVPSNQDHTFTVNLTVFQPWHSLFSTLGATNRRLLSSFPSVQLVSPQSVKPVHLTAPASQRYFEFASTTRHSRNASQTRFEHPALDYPLKDRCTGASPRNLPNPRVPRVDCDDKSMHATVPVKPGHCSAAFRVVEEFQSVVSRRIYHGGAALQVCTGHQRIVN